MEGFDREANETCLSQIKNQLTMLYADQIGMEVKSIRVIKEDERNKFSDIKPLFGYN